VKLKLDENIPHSAARRLVALELDVHTVLDEDLGGHPDSDVWAASQAEARLLITQDLDFSDIRRFAPGTHHGIVLVRLPDAEQWRISDYLVASFSTVESRTWTNCFVVATSNRIRVMRPESSVS
jgi:predicted nuclease of predicted toxin-antitoxin system